MNELKMEEDIRNCWSPTYRNDSRPWLIAPECESLKHETFTTTNRTVFTPKQSQPIPQKVVGKRRQLLEKVLWQQVAEQIKEELMRKVDDQSLSRSEYAEQFEASDFKPPSQDMDQVLQMKKQYPLYGSVANSVWMEKKKHLPGRTCTPLNEPNSVFRKSSAFSKPLNEVLDLPRQNSIGYK